MPSRSPSSGDDGETTKNSSFLKSKKPESEVEDSEAPQSGGEDEEDGDEEYEIEAILDAKKGQFGKVCSAHPPWTRERVAKLIHSHSRTRWVIS